MKHGVLTSEFLLGLLAVLIPPALQYLQAAPNPAISLGGMVLAAVYAILRTHLKTLDPPTPSTPPAASPAAPPSQA